MKISKVFLVCTGVGHINRGYESFAVECFEQLKISTKFELFLLKGAGKPQNHEIKIVQSITWAKMRSPTLAGVNKSATFWVVCI